MRHSNPNMHIPVLHGIEAGEAAIGTTDGDALLAHHSEVLRCAEVSRVGMFLKSKAIAFSQGFVAAYH